MQGLEEYEIKLIHLAYEFGFRNGKEGSMDILLFPFDRQDFKALQRDFAKSHFGGHPFPTQLSLRSRREC